MPRWYGIRRWNMSAKLKKGLHIHTQRCECGEKGAAPPEFRIAFLYTVFMASESERTEAARPIAAAGRGRDNRPLVEPTPAFEEVNI